MKAKNTRQIGSIGEDRAVTWLLQKGFQIITRNYRKRGFEVDIVALDIEGVLRFIEVKTVLHGTEGLAAFSIEHRNIARYFKAVDCFLADNPEYLSNPISMDAIIVYDEAVKYYPNITSSYIL